MNGISASEPGLLRYDRPASAWEEALPIGNGRLGGMVFGDPRRERVALNEDSMWYGGPRDRNNPNALENLAGIRKLLEEGRLREAQDLSAMALSGVPESQRHYLPLGDLRLSFRHGEGEVRDYSRELGLSDGMVKVGYKIGDATFAREIWCSYPDQVMIIRLTCSRPGSLSLKVGLARGQSNRYYDELKQVAPDGIVMRGNCGGTGGSDFRTVVRTIAEGGNVSLIGENVAIEGADSVLLVVAAATSFRFPDPEAEVLRLANAVIAKEYVLLRDRHTSDFRSLMERVSFDLSGSESLASEDVAKLPTDRRLSGFRDGSEDLGLIPLYYQFGRYLLASCSRPGSLPANLQGIWNEHMLPPWDSKYTININTQMNYWAAESGNLAECHEPLFDHIERMREPGRRTARAMYDCGGFVAHHNTDIWADTAPQDIYMPATYWPMGAAWLCLHLWEHYEFGRDSLFLERAYPTMREAAEFFVSYLIETSDGLVVTSPSVSPENTYVLPNGESGTLCIAPSMDSQILHELFSACIEASKTLEMDAEFARTLADLRERLPQPAIGKHGHLLEWLEDYEEAEPGHRHISHLFALHPGSRFTVRGTPEWTAAARVSLERRLAGGGGHTGWSRAWIVNLWARLEAGEEAWDNLRALLAHSTLHNLLDNHPPFQIDGNFGGAAGISEMLLQSHAGEIHLLPALPRAWKNGSITGFRARGGYEVDIRWSEGVLRRATIRCYRNGQCAVRVGCEVTVKENGLELPYFREVDELVRWEAISGGEYVLESIAK
ncbi:glycoside hydrolase family 95 protein [Cohnella lupini]|nr:glycoside hydrolase family 95 protein [Cohnella lupini]